MRYLAVILAIIVPSWPGAFFIDDKITKDYIQVLKVKVQLDDFATGDCWTTLRAVREYAEEKLRMNGGNVKEANLTMLIKIFMCLALRPLRNAHLSMRLASA